jgi:hypothetical protein
MHYAGKTERVLNTHYLIFKWPCLLKKLREKFKGRGIGLSVGEYDRFPEYLSIRSVFSFTCDICHPHLVVPFQDSRSVAFQSVVDRLRS